MYMHTWLHTTVICVTPGAVVCATYQDTSTFRVVIAVTLSYTTYGMRHRPIS